MQHVCLCCLVAAWTVWCAVVHLPVCVSAQESLSSNATLLQEVVVSATRTEKEPDLAPASVSVVTKQDIQKRNISTIDEAMRYVQGVFFERSKGLADTTPTIQLRGLTGQDRTLILRNGLPLNDGYHGGVNWNSISMDDVQRIEVIRGPGSALYGGNAMGGVVNIITTSPQKRSAKLSGGAGTDETRRIRGHVQDKMNKLGWRLGFEWDKTDGYANTPIRNSLQSGSGGDLKGGYLTHDRDGDLEWVVGDRGDQEAERWNLNLRADYDLTEDAHISVQVQRGYHTYDYARPNTYLHNATSGQESYSGIVNLGDGQIVQVEPEDYVDYSGKGETDILHSYATYSQSFEYVDLTAKLGFQNMDDYWTSADPGTADDFYANSPGSLSDSETTSWFADLQSDIFIGESHVLTLGLYARTDDFDADGYELSYYRNEDSKTMKTDSTQGKDRFFAAYIQDEWNVVDRLTVYGGLRFDSWQAYDGKSGSVGNIQDFDEPSDSALSPKIAAVWQPLADTFVRSSLGRAFRAPNIYELYRTWEGSWSTYYSNPDLGPETLWTADISVDQYFWNRRIKLSTGYFQTWAKDFIGTYYESGGSYKDNISEVEIQGIELAGRIQPLDWLSLWANYTYNDSEVIDNERNPEAEGEHLTDTPSQIVNTGLDVNTKWATFSLSGQYLGRVYKNEENDGETDVYGAHTKCWLWNSKLTVSPWKRWSVSLSVENIFDKEYFKYYKGQGRSYLLETTLTW